MQPWMKPQLGGKGASVIGRLSTPPPCPHLPLAGPSRWPEDKGALRCSLRRGQPPRGGDKWGEGCANRLSSTGLCVLVLHPAPQVGVLLCMWLDRGGATPDDAARKGRPGAGSWSVQARLSPGLAVPPPRCPWARAQLP